jgi:hypothetical protein
MMAVSLQNQLTCMTMFSKTIRSDDTAGEHRVSSITNQVVCQPNTSHLGRFRRRYWRSSTLERFGIYQSGSVQYAHGEDTDIIVSTRRNTLLAWGRVSYFLQWTRQYPYGSMLSSLSVYPVISTDLLTTYESLMSEPIDKIQRKLTLGNLHPFTRDRWGWSLLHVCISTQTHNDCTDQSYSLRLTIAEVMSTVFFSSMG